MEKYKNKELFNESVFSHCFACTQKLDTRYRNVIFSKNSKN